MAEEDSNLVDPKSLLLFVIMLVFALIGGYLYVANKKMMDAGIHEQLNKKRKKNKETWSID